MGGRIDGDLLLRGNPAALTIIESHQNWWLTQEIPVRYEFQTMLLVNFAHSSESYCEIPKFGSTIEFDLTLEKPTFRMAGIPGDFSVYVFDEDHDPGVTTSDPLSAKALFSFAAPIVSPDGSSTDEWELSVFTPTELRAGHGNDPDTLYAVLPPPVGSPDLIPPSQITDLNVDDIGPDCVLLTWTAPGDDAGVGQAVEFDVRRSTSPIEQEFFCLQTQVSQGVPAPGSAGTAHHLVISGLNAGLTHYFAIKTKDESGNWSEMSSVASVTTGSAIATAIVVEDDSLAVCPQGDLDTLKMNLILPHACDASPGAIPAGTYEVRVSPPSGIVWDAVAPTDAAGDTLEPYEYRVGSLADTVLFRASAISGCDPNTSERGYLSFQVFLDSVYVGTSPTVRLMSLDLMSVNTLHRKANGSVDGFDEDRFDLLQPPTWVQTRCNNFDWNTAMDQADRDILNAHMGHHIPRKLLGPNGGERIVPGESIYVAWVPASGDSAYVTLQLVRDSAPGQHWELSLATDMAPPDDGAQATAVISGQSNLENGTDYRIKVIHTAGASQSGGLEVGTDVSDGHIEIYGIGCPYVEAWTGSAWKAENSILSRSLDATLSQDAYLVKSEPDATGGKLRLRIYENAQEFTTLDGVAVAALDGGEGANVLHVGSRYVAGTWEPATRVAKVGSEDITPFTDGSRTEYYVGAPGDTLLVELPPLRAVGGEGEGSKFGTAQGGGGSGGSGGGKGIDPAPEGPPDLTTASVSLDDRYLNETGILVQVPDGSGSWQTVQHWYPREHFDDFVVDGVVTGTMRLIFLGKHKLRYLGRFNYEQDGVTPKPARLLAASHSRLGNELVDLRSADEKATIIAPGDTVSFEFEAVPPEAGKTRHWFLVTNGVYSSTAPLGYDQVQPELSVPTYQFALGAARPNPTSGDVSIDYTLATESNVSLRIYNVAGRLVRDLVGERQKAGPYDLVWNLRDNGGVHVPSGVYFYRLVADEWMSQKKVVFIDR